MDGFLFWPSGYLCKCKYATIWLKCPTSVKDGILYAYVTFYCFLASHTNYCSIQLIKNSPADCYKIRKTGRVWHNTKPTTMLTTTIKKKWLNDSDYYIFQLHDSSVNLFLINKICCPNSKSNDVKILVKLKPGIH